jgi:hypothetical protein
MNSGITFGEVAMSLKLRASRPQLNISFLFVVMEQGPQWYRSFFG